jgi:hypothetical protein
MGAAEGEPMNADPNNDADRSTGRERETEPLRAEVEAILDPEVRDFFDFLADEGGEAVNRVRKKLENPESRESEFLVALKDRSREARVFARESRPWRVPRFQAALLIFLALMQVPILAALAAVVFRPSSPAEQVHPIAQVGPEPGRHATPDVVRIQTELTASLERDLKAIGERLTTIETRLADLRPSPPPHAAPAVLRSLRDSVVVGLPTVIERLQVRIERFTNQRELIALRQRLIVVKELKETVESRLPAPSPNVGGVRTTWATREDVKTAIDGAVADLGNEVRALRGEPGRGRPDGTVTLASLLGSLSRLQHTLDGIDHRLPQVAGGREVGYPEPWLTKGDVPAAPRPEQFQHAASQGLKAALQAKDSPLAGIKAEVERVSRQLGYERTGTVVADINSIRRDLEGLRKDLIETASKTIKSEIAPLHDLSNSTGRDTRRGPDLSQAALQSVARDLGEVKAAFQRPGDRPAPTVWEVLEEIKKRLDRQPVMDLRGEIRSRQILLEELILRTEETLQIAIIRSLGEMGGKAAPAAPILEKLRQGLEQGDRRLEVVDWSLKLIKQTPR